MWRHLLFFSTLVCFFSLPDLQAQTTGSKQNQFNTDFGYTDKGDSIEFVFGQQQKIIVSGVEVLLSKRINEINEVNIAGDFNDWKPDAPKFKMNKAANLFKITISKNTLGKKGETRQFKFVLNHKYWVEPPAEAQNKFTGKDKNTNLTLKL
jgi:hypothetical protein